MMRYNLLWVLESYGIVIFKMFYFIRLLNNWKVKVIRLFFVFDFYNNKVNDK